MGENIIHIKGVACPRTQGKVHYEMLSHQDALKTARAAGHNITSVGTAWGGFYMPHLRRAFEQTPNVNLVIANIHGNIKDEKHYMGRCHQKSTDIWAEDFYKSLAEFSGNKPLNVFVFSCGSGNGCLDAAKFLPVGSTLVNVTKSDELDSYEANPAYLTAQQVSDRPYAESLFLNLLAQGYQNDIPIYPQITVSTGEAYEGNTWSMWDAIRIDALQEDNFPLSFETEAINFLKGYFTAEDVTKSLRTVELYMESMSASNKGFSSPETPIIVRHRLDEDHFLFEARKHGLFNVMCAVGYFANRSSLNAFKAGTSEVPAPREPVVIQSKTFDPTNLSPGD